MKEMVTYYQAGFKDNIGRHIPLGDILERIRGDYYKPLVKRARELKDQHGEDSDVYKKYKAYNSPFFTGSGTFSKRNNNSLIKHNGLIVVDFDKLDNPKLAKDILSKDRFTYACFYSIGGNLAVMVKINPKLHEKSFEAIKNYYLANYGLEIDFLKDVARIRFISHDPELYLNESSEIFTPSKGFIAVKAQSDQPDFFSEEEQIEYAERLTEKSHTFQKGERHNYLFMLACYTNNLGVPLSSIDAYCRSKYPHYANNAKSCNAIRGAYKAYSKDFGSWIKPKMSLSAAIPMNGHLNGSSNHIPLQKGKPIQTLSPIEEAKANDPLLNGAAFVSEESASKGVRITFRTHVEEAQAVLSLNGVKILSTGNIAGIIAQPGLGKSQTCEAIVSSFLYEDCDALGFETNLRPGSKILYLDGERTVMDCKRGLQRIAKRAQIAGAGNDIFCQEDFGLKNVIYESFIQIPFVEARRAALMQLVEENDIGLLLMDGIGEFCADPNDQKEVAKLRMWLVSLANMYDFGIITTLHSNPGSDKPRGHLGSELCRVAESIYLLKRAETDREIRRLTTDFDFTKTRNDTDLNETNFKWDDGKKMFVSTDYVSSVKTSVDYLSNFSICLPVGKTYDSGITFSAVKKLYMEAHRVTLGTFKNHLREAVAKRYVIKNPHQVDNNKHTYTLNPVYEKVPF